MIQLDQFANSVFKRGVPKWFELLWILVRSAFFMHSIPIPSRLKAMLLRCFGAKVGQGVVIRSRVNISMPWRLAIGDHCWIGDDVTMLSLAPIKIGSHCCISQRAFLCTGSHDFDKPTFDLIVKPIVIEESCWLGAQSFIGPGVTMAMGSRCLAGAVVVKDTASKTTVGGVPAKVINPQAARQQQNDHYSIAEETRRTNIGKKKSDGSL